MSGRVGHVLQPGHGGVPRYVAQLLDGLGDRGWDSVVAAPAEASESLGGIDYQRVEMTRAPSLRADARAVRRLHRWLKEQQVDVVHTHATKAGVVGGVAAGLTRTRLVHSPHAWPFQMQVSRTARTSYVAWERLATRALRSQVITVGAAERDAALHAGFPASRISVVPTGLPERGSIDQASARRALGLGLDSPVACWVGRDAAQKRPADLVPLARRLTVAGVELVVVGQGIPTSRWAADLLAAGARIASSDDAATAISASDLLVHTAGWEGLPLVALEAMQAGRPVAGYASAGLAEAVEVGVTGVLVPVGDVQTLADEVIRLVADAPLMRAMSTASRQRVAASFNYDSMLDGVVEVYERTRRRPAAHVDRSIQRPGHRCP